MMFYGFGRFERAFLWLVIGLAEAIRGRVR